MGQHPVQGEQKYSQPLHATETGDNLQQLWSTRIERLHFFFSLRYRPGRAMIYRVGYEVKLNAHKIMVKVNLFGQGRNTPKTLFLIKNQTANCSFIILKVKPCTNSTKLCAIKIWKWDIYLCFQCHFKNYKHFRFQCHFRKQQKKKLGQNQEEYKSHGSLAP